MVKQSSRPGRFLGFSLVELVISLAVVAAVAAMAFFGLRSSDSARQVSDSQKNLISLLRSTQSQVVNGVSGVNFKTVNLSTLILPLGVAVSPTSLLICFAHPAYTTFLTNECGSCTAGQFFACNGTTKVTAPITVTFTKGSISKQVIIDGAGIVINRIYAP